MRNAAGGFVAKLHAPTQPVDRMSCSTLKARTAVRVLPSVEVFVHRRVHLLAHQLAAHTSPAAIDAVHAKEQLGHFDGNLSDVLAHAEPEFVDKASEQLNGGQ
jgi:hypothetical protein